MADYTQLSPTEGTELDAALHLTERVNAALVSYVQATARARLSWWTGEALRSSEGATSALRIAALRRHADSLDEAAAAAAAHRFARFRLARLLARVRTGVEPS